MKLNLKLFKNNKKILGNYLNLTFIQLLNSFFYLLIYPFVIQSVGLDNYGAYVFYNSIALYFYVLVNYGFDIHGAKIVASNSNNLSLCGNLFVDIFWSKILLFIFSSFVFLCLIFMFDIPENSRYLFFYCFLNVVSCVFMTSWYFHGIQKLYVVTSIQLLFKLVSLPLIYFSLNGSSLGVSAYALIVSFSNIAASMLVFIVTFFYIKEINWHADLRKSLLLLKSVQPYFFSTACIAVKQRSVELIIGGAMGMRDLALYDLAYKIFSIPTLLVSNINSALFPKFIRDNNEENIKKIIVIEILIGAFIVISISIFGRYFIEEIFGENMLPAYSMSILLSINIFAYLVVGAYIYFVFIPFGEYNFILKNQIISVLSFYLFCLLFYFSIWNIYSILFALIISGFIEIAYCKYFIFASRRVNGKI